MLLLQAATRIPQGPKQSVMLATQARAARGPSSNKTQACSPGCELPRLRRRSSPDMRLVALLIEAAAYPRIGTGSAWGLWQPHVLCCGCCRCREAQGCSPLQHYLAQQLPDSLTRHSCRLQCTMLPPLLNSRSASIRPSGRLLEVSCKQNMCAIRNHIQWQAGIGSPVQLLRAPSMTLLPTSKPAASQPILQPPRTSNISRSSRGCHERRPAPAGPASAQKPCARAQPWQPHTGGPGGSRTCGPTAPREQGRVLGGQPQASRKRPTLPASTCEVSRVVHMIDVQVALGEPQRCATWDLL